MPEKMKVKSLRPAGAMPGHALTIEQEDAALHRDMPREEYDPRQIAPHSGKAEPAEESEGAADGSAVYGYVSAVLDGAIAYCERQEAENIDRDPFEQRRFADALLTRQGELLEVCWSMREKLEQAADYVTGAPAWNTLIEQGVALTAELQKIADGIRAIGDFEKKHADYLIRQMEEFYK